MTKKGLGKGLSALIPPAPREEEPDKDIQWVDMKKVIPNHEQPRKRFDKDKLEELSQSIKEHGVIQPIVVKKIKDKFQIIAGERRWRACSLLEMDKIPAIIKNYNQQQMSEIALIENIQREDLSPIDEAQTYLALIQQHGLTQQTLAKRVGKSRPYIANLLRLLNLPEDIKGLLNEGRLSIGHARALIAMENENAKIEMAYRIIDEGLSVREVELLVAKGNSVEEKTIEPTQKPVNNVEKTRDPILEDLQDRLEERLGTRVHVKHKDGKGKIEINYFSDDELERLLELILH